MRQGWYPAAAALPALESRLLREEEPSVGGEGVHGDLRALKAFGFFPKILAAAGFGRGVTTTTFRAGAAAAVAH